MVSIRDAAAIEGAVLVGESDGQRGDDLPHRRQEALVSTIKPGMIGLPRMVAPGCVAEGNRSFCRG
jgi:hypothetical protein